VLVIAFCWAHRVGEWSHENVNPIKVKKHNRPEKSIFRWGLDGINEYLFKLKFDQKIEINSFFYNLNSIKTSVMTNFCHVQKIITQ
jgi:hypothetical protein